jgi:hypothetical protein
MKLASNAACGGELSFNGAFSGNHTAISDKTVMKLSVL